MLTRTVTVLNQVKVQLQLAAAHRSFNGSKRALQQVVDRLEEEKERESSETNEFVFVEKNFAQIWCPSESFCFFLV